MLPYVIQLIIDKKKYVWKIIVLMIIMFLVGFINPYTYENVFFPFTTYDTEINDISELSPANIATNNLDIKINSIFFFIIFFTVLLIYIYNKKGKLEIRHLLLFGGTSLLALINIRSIPIFIIGTIPLLSNYLKNIKIRVKDVYVETKKYWIIITIFILIIAYFNPYRLVPSIKEGGEFFNKNYDKDSVILYANITQGSYLEYLGFHPYFDTRAEVFTKKANKKEDIYTEAKIFDSSCLNYQNVMNKYNFTHLFVYKNKCLYNKLLEDNYKIIFENKYYVIFESKNYKK